MKKVGEIMAEMGFRQEASDSVKEAFIKHLIKNATGVDVQTPTEKRIEQREIIKEELGVQLSFDFYSTAETGKKVS